MIGQFYIFSSNGDMIQSSIFNHGHWNWFEMELCYCEFAIILKIDAFQPKILLSFIDTWYWIRLSTIDCWIFFASIYIVKMVLPKNEAVRQYCHDIEHMKFWAWLKIRHHSCQTYHFKLDETEKELCNLFRFPRTSRVCSVFFLSYKKWSINFETSSNERTHFKTAAPNRPPPAARQPTCQHSFRPPNNLY